MTSLRRTLLAVFAAALLGASAHAGNILHLNSLGAGTLFSAKNTPAADYKYDVDDKEETPGLNPFTPSVSGTSTLVTWTSLGSIQIDTVMVKVATQYVLWDTSAVNWSLYDGFSVTNTRIVNKKGKAQDVSHVSINFSVIPPPSQQVPDGGATAALLGLGLVTVGCISRRPRR